MSLENKKVLFIAPKFFGYEKEIKKEMEQMGAIVDYFDERPKNTTFIKAAIRLNLKNIVSNEINKYYNSIINFTKGKKYDYVLFIVPETIKEEQLLEIKNNHKTAKFILYMWDSIKNKKNSFELMKYFDEVFTFDNNDLSLSGNIKFRPLFYIKDYENIADSNNFEYDICFIGTAHSDRYMLLKDIEKQAKEKGMKVFYYFYFPSKLFFLFRKIFDKSFKAAKYEDFSFKSLSKNEVVEIISKSRAIIDIQHPKQNGLTMRTLEVFGAKRKLITTNKNIVEYDFYNKDNIEIIERENPELKMRVNQKKYIEIEKNIHIRYSINSWIKEIMGTM